MENVTRTVALSLADLLVSALWVYIGTGVALVASVLAPVVGVSEFATLLVLIGFISICFEILCGALGGASFNPAVDLALFTSGVGSERTHSMVVLACRIPAQMVGAVLGAIALDLTAPTELRHVIGGAKLPSDVNIYVGMGVEMGLAFLLNLAILWPSLARPDAGRYLKSGVPLFATLCLICIGSPYTGASMNPGPAFAWAYFEERHISTEHFLVYWVGTVAGAVLAAIFAGALWVESKQAPRGLKKGIKKLREAKNKEAAKAKEAAGKAEDKVTEPTKEEDAKDK